VIGMQLWPKPLLRSCRKDGVCGMYAGTVSKLLLMLIDKRLLALLLCNMYKGRLCMQVI
jgi:hypothetical protein